MLTRQFKLLVWASLCVPTGRGRVSATLSFLTFKLTVTWDCFLHLRFESNSTIEQDEASLVLIARRNALSWDSFTASRVGKTNLYQNLHVHGHWVWQHKINIPLTWRKIIPNSVNQNRIGRSQTFLPLWQNEKSGLRDYHFAVQSSSQSVVMIKISWPQS